MNVLRKTSDAARIYSPYKIKLCFSVEISKVEWYWQCGKLPLSVSITVSDRVYISLPASEEMFQIQFFFNVFFNFVFIIQTLNSLTHSPETRYDWLSQRPELFSQAKTSKRQCLQFRVIASL